MSVSERFVQMARDEASEQYRAYSAREGWMICQVDQQGHESLGEWVDAIKEWDEREGFTREHLVMVAERESGTGAAHWPERLSSVMARAYFARWDQLLAGA